LTSWKPITFSRSYDTYICCHFVCQYWHCTQDIRGREEGAKRTKSANPSTVITFITPRLWFHIWKRQWFACYSGSALSKSFQCNKPSLVV